MTVCPFCKTTCRGHGGRSRPATRIGRELLFEGGECRRMGLVEYALVKFGIKRTVARRGQKGGSR